MPVTARLLCIAGGAVMVLLVKVVFLLVVLFLTCVMRVQLVLRDGRNSKDKRLYFSFLCLIITTVYVY